MQQQRQVVPWFGNGCLISNRRRMQGCRLLSACIESKHKAVCDEAEPGCLSAPFPIKMVLLSMPLSRLHRAR
jgi:hypothetical protein